MKYALAIVILLLTFSAYIARTHQLQQPELYNRCHPLIHPHDPICHNAD